jgi:hypothetical protein
MEITLQTAHLFFLGASTQGEVVSKTAVFWSIVLILFSYPRSLILDTKELINLM